MLCCHCAFSFSDETCFAFNPTQHYTHVDSYAGAVRISVFCSRTLYGHGRELNLIFLSQVCCAIPLLSHRHHFLSSLRESLVPAKDCEKLCGNHMCRLLSVYDVSECGNEYFLASSLILPVNWNHESPVLTVCV